MKYSTTMKFTAHLPVLLLLLAATSITIDTSYAITRRLGTTHHSLALGGGAGGSASSSSSSLLSVDPDGDTLSSSSSSSRSTDTIVTTRAQRWRRYSPSATLSSASSSNKSFPATSTAPTIPSLRLHLLRGGEVGVKNINKNIKKLFSEGVYVDNEGNLYSSPSSSASTSSIAQLSMKIRGGGTVCVDNERNFYDPFSAALTAAASQQQQRRRRLQSQPQPSLSSSAAVDTPSSRPHHQRIIPASLSKTSASSSSSSRSFSTSKTIPAAHQDH